MPWKVVKGGEDCPYEVQRADTGKRVACHPTESEAMNHVAALYANTPENERATKPGEYSDVENFADPGYLDSEGKPAKGGNGQKRYPLNSPERARNALARIAQNKTNYTATQLASIMGKIHAACKRFDIEVSDDSSTTANRWNLNLPGVIEERDADVTSVNYGQRIVTLVAAPYESPAMINIGGELWQETFERGAWDTLRNMRPTRYRANRGHDKNRTVGKVVNLWPDRPEGLIAEIRLSQTPLGNETLELAKDDCLSASVGFGVMPSGEVRDRTARTRRITTAFLDHIAFVESAAYEDARVLGVRANEQAAQTDQQLKLLAGLLALVKEGATPLERRATPNLDQFAADDMFRWAAERLSGQ